MYIVVRNFVQLSSQSMNQIMILSKSTKTIYVQVQKIELWRSGKKCDSKCDRFWVRYLLEEMKYLIFSFLRSSVEAKRGSSFTGRHVMSPKFGAEWGTKCSICLLYYVWDTAKAKIKYIALCASIFVIILVNYETSSAEINLETKLN